MSHLLQQHFSGQSDRQLKLQETRIAVDNGADEIDMVISRGAFLRGEYSFVHDEIAAVKDACQGRTLKVILETGELCTLDNVRLAMIFSPCRGRLY